MVERPTSHFQIVQVKLSKITRDYLLRLKEKRGYPSIDYTLRKILKEWVEFKKKERCG